ncbi:MAG: hypothetical protein ACI9ZT_000883 [Gammaproteobacteria bacterium]
MVKTLKPRLKASGIHFLLSALVFFVVLYFIGFLWYPNPHFTTNGGWQGVRIILIIYSPWPLLTLLIFNPEKSRKAILFDFSVIGTIQISALIWGLSAVYSQRPLAISFWDGRFHPVLMDDLKASEATPEQLKELSQHSPAIVYVRHPETEDEESGVVLFQIVEGKLEHQIFFLYSPLEKHIDELFEASVTNSPNTNDTFRSNIAHWLEKTGMNEKELAFIPFAGAYGNSILVLNRQGELLDSITTK